MAEMTGVSEQPGKPPHVRPCAGPLGCPYGHHQWQIVFDDNGFVKESGLLPCSSNSFAFLGFTSVPI